MGFFLMEQVYAAALSLVAPPYLYFTVNFIILIIALSSFFHTSPENNSPEEPPAAELMKFLEPPPEQQAPPKEELPAEKPLVSSRFSLRRSPKQSSEGKILGVAKLRRNDSLESTWKAITCGTKEILGGGEEGSWPRAREASLGREDVNRRAEAFIRKIKGDVRMRRQESFKRFSQSISRRAPMLERERDREREVEGESSPG